MEAWKPVLLKYSKRRGQFTFKENNHGYVVTVPLVRLALQGERTFHDALWLSCFLKLFSSQESRFKLHSWPHDSSLFPYRKWLFLILFHKLPNSFHWNPLPLEALDTGKLCSELVCRSYLCSEWQLLTASSPAQTPTARSVKPGHNSELWCWAGNNQVLSILPRQWHIYVEIVSKPRNN